MAGLYISDLVTYKLATSHLASSGISARLAEAGVGYLLSLPADGVFALGWIS